MTGSGRRAPVVRTALYTPAHSISLFDAAIAELPDAIIIDLEDGTPAVARDLARLGVGHLVERCRRAGVVPVVRVNGATTDDVELDLEVVLPALPDAVMVPKADVESVRDVHARLVRAGVDGRVGLWALVETVRSVLAIEAVIRAAPLAAVALGYGDLCKELGLPIATDHPELDGARALIVGAAMRAGVAALDGVVLARDVGAVEDACRASFAAGFHGRTLYHPRHVVPCRAAAASSG